MPPRRCTWPRKPATRDEQARARRGLACAHQAAGDDAQAQPQFEEAIRLFSLLGAPKPVSGLSSARPTATAAEPPAVSPAALTDTGRIRLGAAC